MYTTFPFETLVGLKILSIKQVMGSSGVMELLITTNGNRHFRIFHDEAEINGVITDLSWLGEKES